MKRVHLQDTLAMSKMSITCLDTSIAQMIQDQQPRDRVATKLYQSLHHFLPLQTFNSKIQKPTKRNKLSKIANENLNDSLDLIEIRKRTKAQRQNHTNESKRNRQSGFAKKMINCCEFLCGCRKNQKLGPESLQTKEKQKKKEKSAIKNLFGSYFQKHDPPKLQKPNKLQKEPFKPNRQEVIIRENWLIQNSAKERHKKHGKAERKCSKYSSSSGSKKQSSDEKTGGLREFQKRKRVKKEYGQNKSIQNCECKMNMCSISTIGAPCGCLLRGTTCTNNCKCVNCQNRNAAITEEEKKANNSNKGNAEEIKNEMEEYQIQEWNYAGLYIQQSSEKQDQSQKRVSTAQCESISAIQSESKQAKSERGDLEQIQPAQQVYQTNQTQQRDQQLKQIFLSNSSSDDKLQFDDKRDIDQYLNLESIEKNQSQNNNILTTNNLADVFRSMRF